MQQYLELLLNHITHTPFTTVPLATLVFTFYCFFCQKKKVNSLVNLHIHLYPTNMVLLVKYQQGLTADAFHLSEVTGQIIPVITRISLLIKII